MPAAFTKVTSETHWSVLLRARAMENRVLVLAPAQTGQHHGNKGIYGLSMIVDPWGRVLAELHEQEGVAIAEIDISLVGKARQANPALMHGRPFFSNR